MGKLNLARFDLHLPKNVIEKIEKMAEERAIPPRVLVRSLLIGKIREIEDEKKSKII